MSPSPSSVPPLIGVGRACGKLLLFGEHAVVFGEPALALGLPNGMFAQAKYIEGTEDHLIVPSWNLSLQAGQDQEPLSLSFSWMLEAAGLRNRGIRVELESHLSPGVGMGSSAALCVAISRALADLTNTPLSFARLNEISTYSETLFHGTPSGIDHTVAALGGILRFQKSPCRIQSDLPLGGPMELVVAVVEEGASTKKMVEGVAAKRARHPEVISDIMRMIGSFSVKAPEMIANQNWTALGEMMDINHGLLMSLGVSTTALDQAVHVARAAGAFGAKLTGAGGGGCIIALTPGRQAQVAAALRPLSKEVLCPVLQARGESPTQTSPS